MKLIDIKEDLIRKSLLSLLAVLLICLAVVPTACTKESAPIGYSTYSLQGVTFSYPTGWTDKTSDWNEIIIEGDPESDTVGTFAALRHPSGSADLIVYVYRLNDEDLADVNTIDDKHSLVTFVSNIALGYFDYPSVTNQQETTVFGEWAWEMTLSGKYLDIDTKAYILTVFHENMLIQVIFVVQNKDWNELREVYDMVKTTIVF